MRRRRRREKESLADVSVRTECVGLFSAPRLLQQWFFLRDLCLYKAPFDGAVRPHVNVPETDTWSKSKACLSTHP